MNSLAIVIRSECLTPGQRQRLRKQALAVLAAREDLESRALRVEILAKVERGDQALLEALEVARAAIQAGSFRTVRRALLAADTVARDEQSRGQVTELRSRLEA